MPIHEEFPLDFWDRDGVTPTHVLADMVNEIRGPITAIQGFSQFLLERELPEEMRGDVQAIADSVLYLKNVMEAALVYVKKL
jgi:signal transduction histidine kinase